MGQKLREAAVFDVDGTICRFNGRSPYDTAKCLSDIPNEHVVDLVLMHLEKDHRIVFCSGREDKYESLTCQWIEDNIGLLPIEYEIHMRKTGDFRPDDVIKEEIYNRSIKDKYDIKAVVDDRLRVCRLWHRLGLPLY